MVETRALIVCLGVMVVGAAWVVWERNEKIPTEPVDRPTLVTNNVLNLDDSIKPVVSNLHVDGANSITPKISMSTLFNRPSGALFDVARHCHNLLWKREDVAGSIAACARSNDSGERAECSQQDYLLRKKLAQIDQEFQSCSPVKADIEHAYFVETKRAAMRNDSDAQLCYLQARFNFSTGLSENEEIDYKAFATDFVSAGLSRGDWRVVELMGQPSASFHRKGPYLRRELTDGGSYIVYQMNRLLRLGADGKYAELLDARARAVTPDLTDKEIARANDWAAITFHQDFENSPRLTAAPVTCDSN